MLHINKRGLLPNKKASREELIERVRANLRPPPRASWGGLDLWRMGGEFMIDKIDKDFRGAQWSFVSAEIRKVNAQFIYFKTMDIDRSCLSNIDCSIPRLHFSWFLKSILLHANIETKGNACIRLSLRRCLCIEKPKWKFAVSKRTIQSASATGPSATRTSPRGATKKTRRRSISHRGHGLLRVRRKSISFREKSLRQRQGKKSAIRKKDQ